MSDEIKIVDILPERFSNFTLREIVQFLNTVALLLTHYEYREENEKKYAAIEVVGQLREYIEERETE
jgi:hypothetical protein